MSRFFNSALLKFAFSSAILFLFFLPTSTYPQYFGQNKVRYDDFNFRILKTEHFDIYYYPAEKATVEQAARMAERWYARHSKILQHNLKKRQPLILYASHPDFEETNTTQSFLSEGVGGFTEPLKRRIVMPLGATLEETDHVVGHELVHAFQYDITGQGEGKIIASEMESLPLWFIEGMAELLSLGPRDPLTAIWMRDAVRHPKMMPNYHQLNNPQFFPYRYGQALLAYISGRWGDQVIANLLQASGKKKNIDQAIKEVLQISPDSLVMDWHQSLNATYKPYLTEKDTSYSNARLLINAKHGGGDLNVSPVLSPNGKYLIFFTEKDLLAIDLFLADASTGEILRKLTQIERDPHFESLEFISSAGTWNSNSQQVAIVGNVQGKPVLSLLNIQDGQKTNEFSFPDLAEILNPAWSPDGKTIAFSAVSNGRTDLFLYDISNDSLRHLTNDLYADLQPSWSPDGKQIVFTTDRYSLNVNDLNDAHYGLAIYDLADSKLHKISLPLSGNQTNPQWAADGKTIYFLSDQSGIPNLYKINLKDSQIEMLSDYYTGITGITSLSPAFSLSGNDEIAFSTYENGKYAIYRIDSEKLPKGNMVRAADWLESLTPDPAVLPPINRMNGELVDLLRNPDFGLVPSDTSFTAKPYHPKLSLDYVGQPYVFVGTDRYGSQFGSGISMWWSDILGNNNLATMFQFGLDQGYFNVGGALGYLNQKSRWNWGGSIQQIPYIDHYYTSGYGVLDSNLVYIEQEERLQQMNRDISLFASYPFSRQTRMEFYGGYRRISYDWEVKTQIYDYLSGDQIKSNTQSLPVPSTLSLATASVAYVYDYSIFGATSPVLGQRYRFEVSPVLGSLNYYSLLTDYRRYIMPIRPLTLAGRFLHYGRYGSDSEDNRLLPLFVGYQNLVRGYASGSFDSQECGALGSDCPVFDNLFGSRIAVANLELRAPLFGLLGLGKGYYGVFPIETGLFFDAGLAWNSTEKPSFMGGNRTIVKSFGATARVNFLGFLVFQVSLVNPIDRPQKGWMWQFDIRPGF